MEKQSILKRLNMPKKKDIKNHWAIKYNDDFFLQDDCWGCGLPFNTERCHLFSHHKGGSMHPDNLILLCKMCHNHIQERMTDTKDDAEYIRELIIDSCPFMLIQFNFMKQLIDLKLLPKNYVLKIPGLKEYYEKDEKSN